MNIVVIKGNMARDPEVRNITSGDRSTSVANFAVAVNRHFKRADGTKDKETTFVECEAWDSGAETIGEIFSKGDPVLISGSLKVDSWEQDGQKRSRMKVRVSKFEKLYRAPARDENDTNNESASGNNDAELAAATAGGDGDDIPF